MPGWTSGLMRRGATPQFDDNTNTGTNSGYGVRCTIGGFVDGRLGALTGMLGGKKFAEGCVDSVAAVACADRRKTIAADPPPALGSLNSPRPNRA